MNSLVKQVKDEVRRRQMLYRDLAKELGCHHNYLNRVLNGHTTIHAPIAECLRIWLKDSQRDLVVSLPILSGSQLTNSPHSRVNRVILARAYEKRDCVWENGQRAQRRKLRGSYR